MTKDIAKNIDQWAHGKVYAKDVNERCAYEEAQLSEDMSLEIIKEQARQVTEALLSAAGLKPGQILVLGCSTSEVQGHKIGSYGSTDVAKAILDGILDPLSETGVFLAVQCCEHLNRSVVVEREAAEKHNLTEVSVLPVPHAGGAAASTVMRLLKDPVVVESVVAHAGIDIGVTFIGMRLKPVAVPVRVPICSIGCAHVTVARTRPKLVGGKRAVYDWKEFEERVKGN